MSDFYVGYLQKAPAELARFVRRAVAALGLLAVVLAFGLVLAQMPFSNSTFEYGSVRKLEGTILTRPYPTLLVARQGAADQQAYSEYLLVAPGKHGAHELVAGLDHKHVRLQGQLIYRDGRTMVEVVPASLAATNLAPIIEDSTRDSGPVTLTGEIVDSKCYLGVMNPGSGKVHRDCAARCLSGGTPPIFATTDGDQLLLIGFDGHALTHDVLREFIAEPVSIRGELLQRADTKFLKIDLGELRHTPDKIQAVLRQ